MGAEGDIQSVFFTFENTFQVLSAQQILYLLFLFLAKKNYE